MLSHLTLKTTLRYIFLFLLFFYMEKNEWKKGGDSFTASQPWAAEQGVNLLFTITHWWPVMLQVSARCLEYKWYIHQRPCLPRVGTYWGDMKVCPAHFFYDALNDNAGHIVKHDRLIVIFITITILFFSHFCPVTLTSLIICCNKEENTWKVGSFLLLLDLYTQIYVRTPLYVSVLAKKSFSL